MLAFVQNIGARASCIHLDTLYLSRWRSMLLSSVNGQ